MIIRPISAADLRKRIENGDAPHILDVREPDEVSEASIQPSLHIPLMELPERVSELESLKGHELVVYCRTGNRSTQACIFLELSGFTNVSNLRGGILAWTA